jgi:hypothetical protein
MAKCMCCDTDELIDGKVTDALLCERCQAEWDEVSAANIAWDKEQDRIADERFKFLADTLREVYPTRIPEEWTR